MDQKSKNILLVPLDHGLSMGPIKGLINLEETIKNISNANIDGVILHKGSMKWYGDNIHKDIGIMIHLNASTGFSPDANIKTLIGTVEEAMKLGADGVSIHINLGSDCENEMLKDFGEISRKCGEWGMPLLAMMYVRKNYNDQNIEDIKYAARIASELGADMVKVSCPIDTEKVREVVQVCHIPVLLAGGEKNDHLLEDMEIAMKAGVRGAACGRNIFQNDNPQTMLNQIGEIIHKNRNDLYE